MLEAGTSKAEMARKLKVSRNTLAAFLNRNRTGFLPTDKGDISVIRNKKKQSL